jgi:NAD(P)H-dependent FMN reductase
MRVMGVAGCLRRESYNRALLNAGTALAPSRSTIVPFPLASCSSCSLTTQE